MSTKRCRGWRTGLPLCVLLISFPAYGAEPFRFELRGGFSTVDSDSSSFGSSLIGVERGAGDASTNGLEFAGAYFFRPIEADTGPLREAAFLERAPSLTFSLGKARTDSESTSSGIFGDFASTRDSEASEYGLRYRFVAPQRPWIGIVSYGYADSATAQHGVAVSEWDDERTSYSLGAGRYVGPRTAVTAEYGRSRLESSPLIGGLVPSLRSESLTIGVHSVLPLGTRRHLGLTAALHETAFTSPVGLDDSIGSYELGVTYYPRNDVSIALSTIDLYDAEPNWGDRDRHEYKLEANWFINRSIAVGMAYETTDSRFGFVDTFGGGSETRSDSSGFRFNFSWRR